MKRVLFLVFLFLAYTSAEASRTVVLSSGSYTETNLNSSVFTKGDIDTLMPDLVAPFYPLSAAYIIEYEATCLTPAAPCSIIAIWHGLLSTGLNAKQCSLFIWNDASGTPGARLFSTAQVQQAQSGTTPEVNSYTLPTPIYVTGPFWVGNYELSYQFPTTAVDLVPSSSNKYNDGTGWYDDNYDYYHAAVVKYLGQGPEISVTPNQLVLQIDSTKGGLKSFPVNVTPRNDKKYWEDIVPGEVIIGYKKTIDVKTASLNKLGIAEKGVTLINKELGCNFILVKIQGNVEDEKTFINRIKSNPDVYSAEPNRIVKLLGTSNDPYWSQLWHLDNTNVPNAWDLNGWGNYAISIGIIDEGVEYTHPDLTNQFGSVKGRDVVYSDDDPTPDSAADDHGTCCAGLASATINNNLGIAGVSNSHLYGIKAFTGGSGSTNAVGQSIQWCIDNKVNIISMSLGFGSPSTYVDSMCQMAWDSGAILCASSGNSGSEGVCYPAAYSTVIAVGAIEPNNQLCPFSTYGNEMELVAPGDTIFSLVNNGTYIGGWWGTSMSTPLVAGGAALVWSANPYLTNIEVRNILTSTATDLGSSGLDKYYGYGKPNLQLAVQAALSGNTLPADTGTITVYNSSSASGDLIVTDITFKARWIRSVFPRNFTLTPGSSKDIDVIVQAPLSTGYYYDTLYISSNDSDNNPLLVPITLKAGDPAVEEDSYTRIFDFNVSPNPAGRFLTLTFFIPEAKSQPVTLNLYDASGRQVKALIDELKPAGNYKSVINTTGLGSGIYFVMLKVGNTSICKKISLIQ